jgi:hypothetical protein
MKHVIRYQKIVKLKLYASRKHLDKSFNLLFRLKKLKLFKLILKIQLYTRAVSNTF